MTKVLFAGSTVGEPWWLAGEIARDALRPHGYDVDITDESYSNHNIPWIWSGKAQLGATVPEHFAPAKAGRPEYGGAKVEDLRAIANIIRPSWLGLAVRGELGISSLREVKQKRIPMRLFSPPTDTGTLVDVVLRHHGFSMDEAKGWGSQHFRWSGRRKESHVRDDEVDVMLGNIYHGYTPHGRFWFEATTLYDMKFLDLEPSLIEDLVTHHGMERGSIPELLFRGVDREIPSVMQTQMLIYCRKDQPDAFAETVARALDENAQLFKEKRVPFYWERDRIGTNDFLPLHPAVERYYRSKGYPIKTP